MKLAKVCARCKYALGVETNEIECWIDFVMKDYVEGKKTIEFNQNNAYEKNADGKCRDYKYKGAK